MVGVGIVLSIVGVVRVHGGLVLLRAWSFGFAAQHDVCLQLNDFQKRQGGLNVRYRLVKHGILLHSCIDFCAIVGIHVEIDFGNSKGFAACG